MPRQPAVGQYLRMPATTVFMAAVDGLATAEQLLVLLGALSPLAALLGVWLGKRWEHRSASEAWLRDQRLDAYQKFAAALSMSRVYLERIWRLRGEGEQRESDPDILALTDTIASMGAILGHLELVGPDEVASAASRAAVAYYDGAYVVIGFLTGTAQKALADNPVRLQELLASRLQPQTQPMLDAERTFMSAARQGLTVRVR